MIEEAFEILVAITVFAILAYAFSQIYFSLFDELVAWGFTILVVIVGLVIIFKMVWGVGG